MMTATQKLEEIWELRDKERDTTPLRLGDDPLALSWASYWITKQHPQRRWTDLENVKAHDHDHEIARTTRRFYRDKFMMKMLHGAPLTKFQTDLYEICNDGELTRGHLGMLYRLPYFYEEDIKRQELATKFEKKLAVSGNPNLLVEEKKRTLTPIERIFCSRARHESVEFWFQDQHGYPVKWSVMSNNTLISLVEGLHKQPSIDVTAMFYGRTTREGLPHWHIGHVQLV
jgi:hypothetical protein